MLIAGAVQRLRQPAVWRVETVC